MGKVPRKRYSADFKARVVLEAIKGEQTLAGLGAKHGVHQTISVAWKRQAIDGMAATFGTKAEAPPGASEADVTRLHAKIGQLLMERNLLARASGR
jgi:transposase